VGIPVSPDKAHAVLIVDPDAVLSPAVARQRLEPVAGEGRQVTQLAGCVQLLYPASRSG
jgi:hypothetical protein